MSTDKSDDLKGKINLVIQSIRQNTENVIPANSSSNIANKNERSNNKLEDVKNEWDTLDEPVIETIVFF